jgi:hypothetical protein
MRSDEFAEWWLASDLGRLWEVATMHGVRPDGSDVVALRLKPPDSVHFAAGQITWFACEFAGRPERSPRQVLVSAPHDRGGQWLLKRRPLS